MTNFYLCHMGPSQEDFPPNRTAIPNAEIVHIFSSSTGFVGGKDFKRFGLEEDESFADPVFFVHNMHL